MRKSLACLLVCLCVVGCGAPTLDATSDETLKTSMQRLGRDMNDAQKEQLGKDVMAVGFRGAMKAAFGQMFTKEKKAPPTGPEMMKSLHGLTADQIHAKAEAIRSEGKAQGK